MGVFLTMSKKNLPNLQETIISRSLSNLDQRASDYAVNIEKNIDRVKSKSSSHHGSKSSHNHRSKARLRSKTDFDKLKQERSNPVVIYLGLGNFILLLALIIGFSRLGNKVGLLQKLVEEKLV